MPSRSSKTTRKPKEDFSQLAFRIVQEATAEKSPEAQTDVSIALDDPELRKQVMQEMGRRGGQKGGAARAANLSSSQRKQIAAKAAKARWSRNS